MLRIDLDRLAVICDRVVDFFFSLVGEGAIGVGVGVLRGDLDCFGEICDRAVVVTLGLKAATAAEVGVSRSVGLISMAWV